MGPKVIYRGGSSDCFVDHFAKEIFNSLLGVVYFLVNEGGSSWMVVSLHARLGKSGSVGWLDLLLFGNKTLYIWSFLDSMEPIATLYHFV